MYDPFYLGGGGGEGQEWYIEEGNNERCLKWDGGVINESLLQQL